MPQGRVKWYDDKKGYGFIETEGQGDIFFHKNGIKDPGYFGVQKDEPVSFEIRTTSKGLQAVDVCMK
jgi:CspA family cold shock protein